MNSLTQRVKIYLATVLLVLSLIGGLSSMPLVSASDSDATNPTPTPTEVSGGPGDNTGTDTDPSGPGTIDPDD